MKRILLALLACALLAGCTAAPVPEPTADAVSSATQRRYREGELREYQGTQLDPAVGPRDNSIAGVQRVDTGDFLLTVDGLVAAPRQLTYDEVRALPADTRLLTLNCVEGWDATILWKGVPLAQLIGETRPGAVTVIFHAVDGYTTSLPLAEILENDLLLGYDANGLPLPDEMGYPFILVAQDKWGYKWARWVNRIELSDDTNYRGYWERFGYDNEADLDQHYFN